MIGNQFRGYKVIKLTIGNSECHLVGLNMEQHRGLADLMSYSMPRQMNYYTGAFGSKKQTLLTARGVFPTGLLYLAEKFLGDSEYLRNDTRTLPRGQKGLFELNLTHTPYAEQNAAAEAANAYKRGVIVAPTGVGKSVIAALIIQKLQVPTLILVPSLELKRQLSKSLETTFGVDKVGLNKSIMVINIDGVKGKKITKQYDCVIIDEFHHSGAKTYRQINKKLLSNTYYKIGLTATPFRSQDEERLLLESVLSQVIYRVDYHQAVANGYIVPLEAYYIESPKIKLPKEGNWASIYSLAVTKNDAKNQMIANMLVSLKAEGKSTLCLVKEIKHGETLSKLSNVHFANGQDGDSELLISAFNTRRISCLIGTTGIVGEGVDTKPAEYVIIAGLGKSKNAFMQQVGRAFRTYPGKESAKVIIVLDKSHKWTRDHFRAQLKYLQEEYAVTPLLIEA